MRFTWWIGQSGVMALIDRPPSVPPFGKDNVGSGQPGPDEGETIWPGATAGQSEDSQRPPASDELGPGAGRDVVCVSGRCENQPAGGESLVGGQF